MLQNSYKLNNYKLISENAIVCRLSILASTGSYGS